MGAANAVARIGAEAVSTSVGFVATSPSVVWMLLLAVAAVVAGVSREGVDKGPLFLDEAVGATEGEMVGVVAMGMLVLGGWYLGSGTWSSK